MKCTLKENIANISGKSGNVLFKTYTKADGSKETRVYLLPHRSGYNKYGYERKAPLSQNELASRARFKQVAERINSLSNEEREQYANEWTQNKYCFNGKKYATLRGYIMTRLYADMKNLPE